MKKVVLILVIATQVVFSQSKNAKFAIYANVGQSFRLGETPDGLNAEQKKYVKELKSGLSYDFSAYYLNGENGYGLKYNTYRSSNEKTGTPNFDPLVSEPGVYSDNITITYIGPSVVIAEQSKAKVGEAFLEVSFGYMSYLNKAMIDYQKFEMKAATFGMIAGGGYNFRLHKNFLIGPQVSFVGGTIKKFKVEYESGYTETITMDKDNYESLWRIDLCISAKFKF